MHWACVPCIKTTSGSDKVNNKYKKKQPLCFKNVLYITVFMMHKYLMFLNTNVMNNSTLSLCFKNVLYINVFMMHKYLMFLNTNFMNNSTLW